MNLSDSARTPLLLLACLTGLALPSSVMADDNPVAVEASAEAPGEATTPAPAVPASTEAVPADKETAALAFAGDHHPELMTLIESLKTANPDGYRKAINDLHRTQERIIRLTEKNPVRAAHELELWKIESRIRLAAARSATGDPEGLREELRSLVSQRRAANLSWIRGERDRAAARLSKLDSDLKSAETKESDAVEAEVDRLLKSVKSRQPRVTAAQREAKKKSKAESGKGKSAPLPTTPPAEPVPAVPSTVPDPSGEPTPVPTVEPEAATEPVPPSFPASPTLAPQ